MKRTVLAMIFAMMVTASYAQGYVRIDTVIRPYIEFDYQGWMDADNPLLISWRGMSCCAGGREHNTANFDQVQYNFIPGNVEIYGIEAWLRLVGGSFDPNVNVPLNIGPIPTEYLYLYDARPDTFQLMAQVPIDNIDSVPVTWTCRWNDTHHGDTICKGHFLRECTQIDRYRYYFDTPVQVSDSFYVGCSYRLNRIWEMRHDLGSEAPNIKCDMYVGFMSSVRNDFIPGAPRRPDSCEVPFMKKKVRWGETDYIPGGMVQMGAPTGLASGVWVPSESRTFWMIFPLIKTYDTIWAVDTPACLPVRDFGIMSRYGDTVILRWTPDVDHNEYQVSFYPSGTDPDNGTMVTVTTNRCRYIDTLHTGQVMEARVRTMCRELDTLRYSEWSDAVEWQTSTAGLSMPDGQDNRVALTPNPARHEVSVSSQGPVIDRIEVFAPNGTLQHVVDMRSRHVIINVRDWARGVYLMVMHTTEGRVSKKLVVE